MRSARITTSKSLDGAVERLDQTARGAHNNLDHHDPHDRFVGGEATVQDAAILRITQLLDSSSV
jgi:hypothetical protein